MKKLLGISVFSLMLTACSQSENAQQKPLTREDVQQLLHKSLQECRQEVGDPNSNPAKFDACMDSKGFEVRKEQKAQPTPQASEVKTNKKAKSK